MGPHMTGMDDGKPSRPRPGRTPADLPPTPSLRGRTPHPARRRGRVNPRRRRPPKSCGRIGSKRIRASAACRRLWSSSRSGQEIGRPSAPGAPIRRAAPRGVGDRSGPADGGPGLVATGPRVGGLADSRAISSECCAEIGRACASTDRGIAAPDGQGRVLRGVGDR
jgi:hypothetical protein